MIITAVLILLMLPTSSNSLKKPVNVVVKAGDECLLPCSFNEVKRLIFWLNDGYHSDEIFDGHLIITIYRNNFEIVANKSETEIEANLKFKKASLQLAGLYTCTTSISYLERGSSVNVIVVADDITCNISSPNVFLDPNDRINIICDLRYKPNTCTAEAVWTETVEQTVLNNSINVRSIVNDRTTFVSTIPVDENFKNGSSFSFSIRFNCPRRPKLEGNYSEVAPVFISTYVTPKYYLKEITTTTSSTTFTTTSAKLHSGAAESNPSEKGGSMSESSTMTLTMVFAGILAFFAILVVILVGLFLTKYRKNVHNDAHIAYTGGCTMMTENIAYRRQPVSCENSYNMQTSLTPPLSAFQGVIPQLHPPSSTPLYPGPQQYHRGLTFCPETTSVDDSEVYDKINDDKGMPPCIYIDANKRMPIGNPLISPKPASSSSPPPFFVPTLAGYAAMNSSRIANSYPCYNAPASPHPFVSPDPGLYLVPQDKAEASK